jgi:hypothetical protein
MADDTDAPVDTGTDPQESEYLIDDSPAESFAPDATDEGEAPLLPSPSSPTDPYRAQFDRYEREIGELKTTLNRFVSGQQGGLQPGIPAAFSKPRDQWTVDDLFQANQYMMHQQLSHLSAEHAVRGQLSAQILGQGNDYDSVQQRYVEPLVQRNPEIAPFVHQLPPEDRYMLGLLHEIHQRSGGDLVKTIKAVRNALGARQEGARDVTNKLNSAARTTAMSVFQGGGGRQTGRRPLTSQDVWNMSDADFRKLSNKASGR